MCGIAGFLETGASSRQEERHGRTKWILRQLLYRYVPKELVDRPKSGFAVPLSAWLRGPLREWAAELLAPARLRHEGYFQYPVVRQIWTEHLSKRRNWEQPLWSILMFQAWLSEQQPVLESKNVAEFHSG